MTKDEALKLALEALHGFIPYLPLNDGAQCGRYDKAITAIKEALAQQDSKDKEQAKTDSFVRQLDEALEQPEPWEKFCDSNCVWTDHHPDCKLAEQEPLTDEEIEAMWPLRPTDLIIQFARAIEAAHGIKGKA